MKIDPGSHVPIYLQIADQLRSAIAAGVYRPGEPLPSQRNLAVQVQVNPNTVQRAYDELLRQGIAVSQRGRGLFVSEEGTDSASSHAQETVRVALDEAIRAARAAGISARVIRSLFQAALQDGAHQESESP